MTARSRKAALLAGAGAACASIESGPSPLDLLKARIAADEGLSPEEVDSGLRCLHDAGILNLDVVREALA